MSSWDITDEQAYEYALARLSQTFDVAVENVDENVKRAVMESALDCLGRAMDRAPIESGDLRSSGYANLDGVTLQSGSAVQDDLVLRSERREQEANAVVGFALPYAHKQHEDLSLSHDRTDGYRIKSGKNAGQTVNMVAGGQAKYLDSVVMENADKWAANIGNAVKKAVEEVQ